MIQILRMTADDLTDPGGLRAGMGPAVGLGDGSTPTAPSPAWRPATIPPVAELLTPGDVRPDHRRRPGARGRARALGDQLAARARARRGPARLADAGVADRASRSLGSPLTACAPAAGRCGCASPTPTATSARTARSSPPCATRRCGRASPSTSGRRARRRPRSPTSTATAPRTSCSPPSDGQLRVYAGRTGRMLRGWPRPMADVDGSPAAAAIGPVRAGFIATPAVGDVDGDRRLDVVAAGLDGRVYAWNERGRPLRGFPFRIDLHAPAENGRARRGDLRQPRARRPRRQREAGHRRRRGRPARLRDRRARPLAARLAGTGPRPERRDAGEDPLVAGHRRHRRRRPPRRRRGHGRGLRHDAGDERPRLRVRQRRQAQAGLADQPRRARGQRHPAGGPGRPRCLRPSPTSTATDATRSRSSAFTGQPELYRGDGTRMSGPNASGSHFAGAGRGAASDATAPSALALGASGAFGRVGPGGPLRFFGGLIDSRLALAQELPAQQISVRPPASAAGTRAAATGCRRSRAGWRAGRS